MDSSAPSGQASDPFPSNRLLEIIGICIACLTLTLPFVAIMYTSSPIAIPGTSNLEILTTN
ncbi:MAG: hypothetical protein ACOYME_12980 [Prochlorotrichaceae cyanobacterium]